MGRFVLDFFCPQTPLAIEVDGPTHDAAPDRERDAWLSAQGIRVIRFSHGEVLSNLDGVLATILSAGGGHGLDRS